MSSTFIQELIALVIAGYMLLVRHTTRWTIEGEENVKSLWENGGGLVLCYWHSRIIMAPSFWPLPPKAQNILMLVSHSRDGQPAARACEMVGYKVVRGSSTRHRADIVKDKGALQAVRALITHAKTGGAACITPDGPRGPRMRVQIGATRIAKSANVPMLPVAIAVKGAKYLKSWDRFVLPPPLFGKGVIIYGAPIMVLDNDEEGARQKLETNLGAISARADMLVGAEPIVPEDLPNA